MEEKDTKNDNVKDVSRDDKADCVKIEENMSNTEGKGNNTEEKKNNTKEKAIDGKEEKEDILISTKDSNDLSKEDNVNCESELLDRLRRLQAEFENFRKRTDRERQEFLKSANKNLIFKLLGVLDNFELAMQHNDDKGVKMIYSELYSIMEREGLSVIADEKKFNPEFHEVLIQEDGEEDGIIIETLQKGYKLNDKVIRASKVKVSKMKEQKISNVDEGEKNE